VRALAIAVALALAAGTAHAQLVDYDPNSDAWNGLSSFKALAGGMGKDVTTPSSVDWSELTADDILVIVYPLQAIDARRLEAFIQAGGNALIADDFGEARDALSRLGLIRSDRYVATRFYENKVFAPIATAKSSDHPIARDVGDVVTNHPASFSHVSGGTVVFAFDDGALVVAGERGTGRFVALADPSVLINRMQQQQFGGNVQLATNMLRWLDRDGRARRVVMLRGDVTMFGDPQPFIADPNGGSVARSIGEINQWLRGAKDWLLMPSGMQGLAAALATLLLVLAVAALPVRRGPKIDGAWLRFGRPVRRDEPHAVVAAAERAAERGPLTRARSAGPLLVLACVMRDQVQVMLAGTVGKTEPLYTMPESELVAQVATARGTEAGIALTRVYRRLRALPSRGQAAAPWSAGQLARRDFDALYRDVAELCRTLGQPLSEAVEA